jgi:hypothetical protein
MLMANPDTGEVTEGQVEAIIKAGLQRLSWPAVLVLYGVRLGVRVPPKQGNRRYGPAERRTELKQLCAEGGAPRRSASLSSYLRASSPEEDQDRTGRGPAGQRERRTTRASWWSGWAGRLGGGGGWRCLGESLGLLDELAEPFDGPLVGAEVVALQGLLGAPVLCGLLLEDPRQRR